MTAGEGVTLELLRKYDRPGPRYTSYPTAVEFDDAFTVDHYRRQLAAANAASGEPLSMYIHLPFCHHRCSFCGCHVIATEQRRAAADYLERLHAEIELLAAALPDRRHLVQLHWGGGTPTYLTSDQLRALHGVLTTHFVIERDAEVAVEVDPRVTTAEHVDTLVALGFNRLSMGVQDFTPAVQEAIGRHQTEEQTRRLYAHCRDRGLDAINIDLIYGLPRQTVPSFRTNLETVLELRPGRVACYSYAYMPWARGNQRAIAAEDIPPAAVKLELFSAAIDAFTGAGYRQIGMDHFALPEDELSLAVERGALHRNFMGYTVKPASDFIGLGISAIGDVRGAYAQNEKKLSTYYQAIDAGRFPIQRGRELSRDDLIRRDVITRLMCNFRLAMDEVGERHGIDFADYFAAELEELEGGLAREGMVTIDDPMIVVPPRGQLFIRNVCMVFDAYLKSKPDDQPLFSRTV